MFDLCGSLGINFWGIIIFGDAGGGKEYFGVGRVEEGVRGVERFW